MIGLAKSIIVAMRLYLMRRTQFDSVRLRRYFAENHDIHVGLYSYGCFDRWRMPGPMQVGRYCSISTTTRSVLQNHPMTALTTHPALYDTGYGVVDENMPRPAPLVLEDDVWIGHHVVITPGCKRIGRGAVIGAGSVVTKDVAAYSIVAGNPARKIRDRFAPSLAAAVEASRWWELDLTELGALVREQPSMVFSPSAAEIEAWIRKAGR
jgi:virginiamycin A acetyltransferase